MAGVQIDGVNNKIDFDDDQDTSISANTDDTLVIEVGGTDVVTLTNSNLILKGTTPTLTIGDGGAEDTKLLFDGNAQNFYIGLDDSADDLLIGLGSAVGTTPAISINENNKVTLPDGQMEIIVSGNYANLTLTTTDGDANFGPELRLYRNSSSPAPNDVIGIIDIEGRNDNSEDIIYQQYQHLIADETDGTEDGYFIFNQMKAGTLTERYRIETGTFVINDPGADFDFRIESDNNANMFFVDASTDHVCIGTNAPSDGDDASFNIEATGSKYAMKIFTPGTGTAGQLRFHNDNGTVGNIHINGSTTTFATSSDYRLKENVNYSWDATTELKKLKPAKFNFKADASTTLEGFLAHEVADVVPIAVDGEKDAVNDEGKIEPQSIDQSKLVPLMVKTIQELEARITTLEG